jgi:hypothetical protein
MRKLMKQFPNDTEGMVKKTLNGYSNDCGTCYPIDGDSF